MKKVKVVQLITTMADGGAETLVKDYALLCDREKFDMTVVAWSEPLGSANERILKDNGISVVYLGEKAVTVPTNSALIKIYRRLKKYLDFRRIIVSEGCDVLHIHLRFGLYTKVLPRRVLKRSKLFYTVHNEPERFFNLAVKGKKKYEYKEAKRLSDKFEMTFITLHNQMNDEIRKMFATDRVVTINNGVNLERFVREKYDTVSVKQALGIDENVKIIGHVGSYTEQKNHELLINIFEKYLENNDNSILMLIGKGRLKNKIIQDVSSRGLDNKIIFLENRSDVPDLMSIMDVFMLPSRWEGFPIVMIEAQAMGLKCVMSDRVTKDAILTNNVTVVGLDEDISCWIDAIDNKRKPYPACGTMKAYDINESISKLQELYCAD